MTHKVSYWILAPFLSETVEASLFHFFENWLMKLKFLNLLRLLILLPLRADLLCILQYETPCTYFWRIQTEEIQWFFFPVIISDYNQSFFIETSKLLKCTEGCDSIEKPNKRPHFDEGFMSNRWRPLGLSGCLVNFYF